MKKFLFILSSLLFSCANYGLSYTTHESETLGLSFEYPDSWVIQVSEIEVNVATDERLFAADTVGFNEGAVVNFSTLPLAAVDGNIEVALAQFTGIVVASEGVTEAGEVDLFTLSGHNAAQTRVNLTEAAMLQVVMIEDNEQVILVAAVYDADQYEEIIVHLVESITFIE